MEDALRKTMAILAKEEISIELATSVDESFKKQYETQQSTLMELLNKADTIAKSVQSLGKEISTLRNYSENLISASDDKIAELGKKGQSVADIPEAKKAIDDLIKLYQNFRTIAKSQEKAINDFAKSFKTIIIK